MTYAEQESLIAAYFRNHIMVPDHLCEVRGLRFRDGRSFPLTVICDNAESTAFWSRWMNQREYHVYHTRNPISPTSEVAKLAVRAV